MYNYHELSMKNVDYVIKLHRNLYLGTYPKNSRYFCIYAEPHQYKQKQTLSYYKTKNNLKVHQY